jgi:hypothetical protein
MRSGRVTVVRAKVLVAISDGAGRGINDVVELLRGPLLGDKGYKAAGGNAALVKGDVQRSLSLLSSAGRRAWRGPRQGGEWKATKEGKAAARKAVKAAA